MRTALALVDDLFFAAKMLETAKHIGLTLKTASTADALLALARETAPGLVIVDLNARAGGVEAIERLRAAGNAAPVVAFLSHVQVELAERARAAGCAQVLPRSQFTRDLPQILASARAEI
jgi:DNA-binding NarL/FixJ family response regulator